MTIFDLIANSAKVPMPEGEAADGICCFTGRMCKTLPRKDVLDKTFNKHDFLRAPDSDRVGVNVLRALSLKEERMSCWIATPGKFYAVGESNPRNPKDLTRAQARQMVIEGVPFDGPWAGYWTTSYKKHGAYVSPVNFSGKFGYWGFETMTVDCRDYVKVRELFDFLMGLKTAGMLEAEMRTLDFSRKTAEIFGMPRLVKIREILRPKANSPLFEFMLYLLLSAKEIKDLGKEAGEKWPMPVF